MSQFPNLYQAVRSGSEKTMTKKDYELIARTIASLDLLEEKQREYVAASFAVELATTNPNFNSGRFLSACGFEGRP